jgi:cytochrome b
MMTDPAQSEAGSMTQSQRAGEPSKRLHVWDLPVRLFHWTLVVLLAISFTTAQIGGNALQYHEWSGFTVLALVLFRVLWGFLGSTHARFADFVRGPRAALAYGRSLLHGPSAFYAGHNPLGGWMVVLLLAGLLLQAATGLFANDDVMIEGPLARHVSKDTSDLLTHVHKINFNVLATLLAVHVAAALYYLWVKRENLIRPMITGYKLVPHAQPAQDRRGGPLWLAAVLLALCAAVVWGIVRP